MAQTFTGKNRMRMIELHGENLSCREIAKRMGFSPATISKHAKAAGLAFGREQTSLATRAHTVDLEKSRLSLAQKLMVVAHEEIDGLSKPHLVFNFGGKDNTYEEHELDRAPIEVKQKTFVMAGIAIDKATRIIEKDNGGLESTVGVLDALAGNLHAAAAMLRAEGETPAGDPDAA